jgi:hypothetical protein
VTGDDLKRMQGHFLEGGKTILLDAGRLRPVGFVITLHKHLDKLFESGWGIEFIDPKSCLRGERGDDSAVLILDLLMDWKRMYHAVLNVFPQTRDVLPPMITLAETIDVDNPYMRVMRPFLTHTQMDEKDIIAATMRHVCGQVDAFACIMQSEAWMRFVDPSEDVDKISARLGDDQKSVEVVISSMETYEFARLITVPVHRKVSSRSKKRDEGKVISFGESTERLDTPDDTNVAEGRFVRFLKPLETAS